MVQTVKQFITDSYQLISANTPTVPLQGNDMLKGIQFMNQLLKHYSATGLMLTIAKQVDFTVAIGQSEITFADTDYIGVADVKQGRLANLADAWLTLDNVTYPLIIENRDVFLGSYKYDPQLGLPRFVIVYNETALTRLRIYPGASQLYKLSVYGKFELSALGENDDMSSLPLYYTLFFQLAVSKYMAAFKGRASAWTQFLEDQYREAKQDMESVSAVNVVIQSANESMLNGFWRVKSGV
jgi:hypothetical protein